MSSLEMVGYINSTRKAGEPALTQPNFLAKVAKVLGATSHSFECDVPDSYGRPRKVYNFPKREAMLMAMSYSYELQAQVFDAWEAAEAALVKPAQNVFALPDFSNPAAAARARWHYIRFLSISRMSSPAHFKRLATLVGLMGPDSVDAHCLSVCSAKPIALAASAVDKNCPAIEGKGF